MKKSILAVALLTISTTVSAVNWFTMTKPELLINAGSSIGSDENNTVTLRFSGQEKKCHVAYVCYNPSLTFLVTDDADAPDWDNEFNDQFNAGAGFDIKYKYPRGRNNAYYIEAGPVAFIRPLTDYGNNKINLHAGVGMEVNHFIISVDAYGTESPLYMLSGGYRF